MVCVYENALHHINISKGVFGDYNNKLIKLNAIISQTLAH